MDVELVLESIGTLLGGVVLTLELTALSLLVGFALSVPLAFLRASPARWLSWPVLAYTYVFRGTPLLVQLFLVYYGLSQVALVRESVLWLFFRDPFCCALLAFSLNSAAYTTEVFRGGIQAVPAGMTEAAQAIGLSPMQIRARIVFPLAFRVVLPSYTNEVVGMLKASSLASTVTLLEITGLARKLVSETFAPYEVFLAAGAIYLGLTFLASRLSSLAELYLSGAPPNEQRRPALLRARQAL
jgi:octopine/nopaline transport system permease protein